MVSQPGEKTKPSPPAYHDDLPEPVNLPKPLDLPTLSELETALPLPEPLPLYSFEEKQIDVKNPFISSSVSYLSASEPAVKAPLVNPFSNVSYSSNLNVGDSNNSDAILVNSAHANPFDKVEYDLNHLPSVPKPQEVKINSTNSDKNIQDLVNL